MAGITDLICKTADGKLSFGNFDLDSKQKRSDDKFPVYAVFSIVNDAGGASDIVCSL